MDVEKYLSRIEFNGSLKADIDTLRKLHRQHLLHVPFEDIDIHYKRPFDLKPSNVFDKVVNRRRGGFCYEVNSLFNELLRHAGFRTRIISGKVITDAGDPGPEYDHMAIIIHLDKDYIADVGFGDLFIEPLEMREGLQNDGRNYFRIEREGREYAIFMSPPQSQFQKKYTFTLDEAPMNLFERPCYEKQVSPDSHFVRNTICTKLTESGRITIYNEKFIETIGDQKTQTIIRDDDELRSILRDRFNIEL